MVAAPIPQLSRIISDNRPQSVFKAVIDVVSEHYGRKAAAPVRNCYNLTIRLFRGRLEQYQKCNTDYHDLPHTMDVFLAAARILDGYILAESKISEDNAVHLLMSALLHDAGYIQEKNDHVGTGAKYTFNHVERSMNFVRQNRDRLFLAEEDAESVARMIKATEFILDFRTLSYASAEEQRCGAILAAADLVGQMADRIYLEKLLFLYNEFREAGMPGFNTEFDILRKTNDFYNLTRKRLDESLEGIGRYAQIHFLKRHNIDANLYETAIEKNMAYLNKIISDAATNFRHKLHRGAFSSMPEGHKV